MKVAIDGPAGAGKSTVARRLAQELGLLYIDTGAMYRALTWKALQNKLDINDVDSLFELANSIDIHFEPNCNGQKTICDGIDVTTDIRSPEVSEAVSTVAFFPSIRQVMVKQQQEMACNNLVVMDGRDIGECVLPDADYKIFLTASIEERAKRRQAELLGQGYDVDTEQIKRDIAERDRLDSQREVGALKVLPDSLVIDTSLMSVEQVLELIKSLILEG